MMLKLIVISSLLVSDLFLISDTKESSELIARKSKESVHFKTKKIDQIGRMTFKSYLNDIEQNYQVLQTNRELTYHTFDGYTNTVTVTAKSKSSGEWSQYEFKFHSVYEDGTDIIFVCKDQAVKEIWLSPDTGTLGYDYFNGQRHTYYELEED